MVKERNMNIGFEKDQWYSKPKSKSGFQRKRQMEEMTMVTGVALIISFLLISPNPSEPMIRLVMDIRYRPAIGRITIRM